MRNEIALLLCAAVLAPAEAHVTLAETSAPANSYYVASFRVGHGCSGSPTTALRIEIPQGIVIARPQPKPGWTLEIEHAALDKPLVGEGGTPVTSRVSAIVWKGGALPADQFDVFSVMMKLPAQPGALLFPVTQNCVSGVQYWNEPPMEGMHMPHQGPVLTVTPASPGPVEHTHGG